MTVYSYWLKSDTAVDTNSRLDTTQWALVWTSISRNPIDNRKAVNRSSNSLIRIVIVLFCALQSQAKTRTSWIDFWFPWRSSCFWRLSRQSCQHLRGLFPSSLWKYPPFNIASQVVTLVSTDRFWRPLNCAGCYIMKGVTKVRTPQKCPTLAMWTWYGPWWLVRTSRSVCNWAPSPRLNAFISPKYVHLVSNFECCESEKAWPQVSLAFAYAYSSSGIDRLSTGYLSNVFYT